MVALRVNRSLLAHSSTSQSHSKKTQQFHFQATFESEDIQLVTQIRKFHQHNIELLIENLQKKRSYNTKVLLQTKDLKCATYLLNEKFINMSEEKKTIVRDLGFGGLMHIPPLRVNHQLLRELANNFKLGENRLETGYGSFKIRPKTIGDALGINASGDIFPQKVNYKKLSEDDKEIFRRFQGKTLKSLTDEMMDISVGNEQDRLIFKMIFILYIQMAFLLPTTINKISPGITDYKKEKKKAIDGCLFALMIIYFHLSKNKDKKRAERPQKPWIANWSKEQLVERMRAEIEKNMASSTSSSETETTDSDSSTSEFETREDLEDSPRKEPSKKGKKTQSKKKKVVVEHSSPEEDQSYHGYSTFDRYEIGSEDLDELLRENNENSAAQGEKEADLRSTEGHYVPSETLPDVNLGSDDPSSQGLTEQSSVNRPAESMLSLVEESASEPADSNMMVVREETPFEGLAIVPIQVCLPVSQTTTVPEFQETTETEYEPTPLLQIEGPTKTNPAPEDAAALMMMARTASYVSKTDPMPSFSLGFTDSSQEETTMQEGTSMQDEHRAKTLETPKLLEQLEDLVHKIASGGVTKKEKSPPIPKESGTESFEKFETPVRPNLNTTDMKQKCYHWAIQVKTYSNGRTDEFDDVCRLQAQDRYTLSKFHLASLAPKSHIEAEIVTAMCFIINQQNIPRFQEEVYCLPLDIVNMALANHPDGIFLQPKNDKPFRVEDYLMFIPFLDLQKLKSHCYWLWIADTRKRKFYIVDPLHNKSPSDARTALNKFVYMLGAPLKSKDMDREIVAPYLKISGQKTSYDCAIYVLRWLEIFEPANIKRRKYEWDNLPQDEVDHFRVEYASRILFHDMNLDKDEAIRGSNAIRLSKPSSLLLSPYCQIDSQDVETT
ncbi:hypothetical protein Ahy_B05g077857 [Arachis hypogaea]|uniref:Ubiquitin-like protease family profile domain-containing protein n=1 Tax=Arachis hypogaea TaxID=3818 RepID=A0A444Z5Q3_ARAHY|nr:hypothetical protein Ahy_B05g077857 [Arachis hypogaea]